ncbi:MAG: hypothetical protein ACOY93_06535 [Bacillota bacterium]
MRNVRCRCGKIVCQVESLTEVIYHDMEPPTLREPAVMILCRHCKRYVVLKVPDPGTGPSSRDPKKAGLAAFFSNSM